MRHLLITPKPLSALVTLVLVCIALLWSGAPNAMLFFGKKASYHLSPEINGVITLHGKPVSHVEVTRTLDSNQFKQPYVDTAITDSQGKFSFPEKEIEDKKPSEMTTVVRSQNLEVEYSGKKYLLWFMSIPTIRPVDVVKEKLHFLECDLDNAEEYFDFHDAQFSAMPFTAVSICRWKDN